MKLIPDKSLECNEVKSNKKRYFSFFCKIEGNLVIFS